MNKNFKRTWLRSYTQFNLFTESKFLWNMIDPIVSPTKFSSKASSFIICSVSLQLNYVHRFFYSFLKIMILFILFIFHRESWNIRLIECKEKKPFDFKSTSVVFILVCVGVLAKTEEVKEVTQDCMCRLLVWVSHLL